MSERTRTRNRRGIAASRFVLALAAIAALAGCVGIPTSGSVAEGGVVRDAGEAPLAVLASGPQKGATPQEILTDFMQAARSPEGNYEIARQFLTTDAAEAWKPGASVLIREGTGTQITRGPDSIDFSVSTRASVNASGLYTEERTAATQRLPFEFEKQNGEWRISSLDDGTVLSRDNFLAVFETHALYYFDPSYRYLVPDIRWFPVRSNVATRIASALLAGQADWLAHGATLTAFPQGTRLATAPVEPKSGLALVDLTEEAGKTSNLERARMQQQLVTSLGSVSVNSVTMSVTGVPLAVSDPDVSKAVLASTVQEPEALIRKDAKFGFASGDAVTKVAGLTAKVIAVNARAVTLGRGQTSATALGTSGAYLLLSDNTAPLLVDKRAKLAAPSIDTWRYVWSMPAAAASKLQATGPDGVPHAIASSLPADARVVSFDVSRDGSRVLVYLQTDARPRLVVAAVVRRDGVPTELGPLVDLPVPSDGPIDATWVDDRTVATIASSPTGNFVTAFPLGGPAESLGRVEDGRRIVGGNGINQIRVLTTDGTIFQLRDSGWQSTGISADVLATQQ